MRDGEKPMIMRVLSFSRFAALLIVGLAFGAAPAAAQCGGCYAAAPVVVQPVYYQSCSCCGCGAGYYGAYYQAAYVYPTTYGAGCCGTGYGYGYGGYTAGYEVAPRYVAPRVYAPRVAYPRYVGPARYYPPRRALVARY